MTVSVRREGGAAVVSVDRPARRNAIEVETLKAIAATAKELKRDTSVRAVVLTGAAEGGGFLAGGDLQSLHAVKTARGARDLARTAYAAVDALRELRVPLVAAVCGDAHGGGCELAAACDYRVVERQARFHWVQLKFAVTTGWGGVGNLSRLVSEGTAMRWLLTGAPVASDEAERAGFADRVVETGEGMTEALAFATQVAKYDRNAVRSMVTLLRESRGLSEPKARAMELQHFGRAWASTAHAEAVARFLARGR